MAAAEVLISGKVDLGRGGGRHGEPAGLLDCVINGIPAGVFFDPGVQPAALDGRVLGTKVWKVDDCFGGARGEMFAPPGFFGGEDVCEPGHGRGGVKAHCGRKRGEDLVTEAVAGVGGGLVGGVFDEWEITGSGVVGDILAGAEKQRAFEGQSGIVEWSGGAQGGETAGSAAAGQVKEHGFGNVAGVVSEKNPCGAVAPGSTGEERAAEFAGGFLEGFASLPGALAGAPAGGDERQVVTLRELAHVLPVSVGLAAAQSVVVVGHDERGESGAVQQVEKHDGINAAGDGDNGGGVAREVGDAFGQTRQQVGRFFHGNQATASRSAPKRSCRIGGRSTEPSGCCPFSKMATKSRASAVPEPLRVWQKWFLPSAPLKRRAMRRAW